jgi:hypothetical protein
MRKAQRRSVQPVRATSGRAAPWARTKLAERYEAVRRATQQLVGPLSPEDCALQAMPDATSERRGFR